MVLLPFNPWDHGTRDNGQSDVESMVDVLVQTGASGMNGDTMNGVNRYKHTFFQVY